MVSLQSIKKMLNPVNTTMPEDDFRIIDSWSEFDGHGALRSQKLKYLCYEIEALDPETGTRTRLYKAVKFARVIRLPKSAKQSLTFMQMQSQVLSAAHEQGYNLITMIANMIRPVPEGLMFLYGVQGVSDNIEEAKKNADYDYNGFIHSMMGTFRVLELRTITAEEGTWLEEKMRSMKYMTAVRGIPKANEGGEDMGNKGMGGANLNPDSQGTLEEIITAMADYEYIIEVLATPVRHRTLMSWQTRTQKQMTDWYEQLQGTKSISFNLSLPMTYMTSTGSSQGWSKNYTDSHSVSYTQGESFSNGYSSNVGHSLSHTLGESFGVNKGTSITDSAGQSYSVSTGQSHSVSQGVNEGLTKGHTVGQTQGQSIGQTIGYTQGTSRGTSSGITIGTSQGSNIGQSNNISNGMSLGKNVGMSSNSSYSNSVSQGYSMSNSQSQNVGSSFGQNIGNSTNISAGQSSNLSHSLGSNASSGYGTSQGVNMGNSANLGQNAGISSNKSFGQNASGSSNVGASTNFGQSAGISSGYSTNVGTSQGENHSTGQNIGVKAAIVSFGGNRSNGTSTGTNQSSGTNVSANTGNNYGLGYSAGSSVSNGLNASAGSGTSYGQSVGQGASMGVSEGLSTNSSAGKSESYSVGNGSSYSQGYGASYGQSQGQSYSNGISSSQGTNIGNSSSASVSQGQTSGSSYGQSASASSGASSGQSISVSISQNKGVSYSSSMSQSVSQNVGQSFSQSISDSLSQSYSQSRSESVGETSSESVGQTTSKSVGQSQGESYSKSTSDGTGESWGESNSVSKGQNYGTSNGQSTGTSVGSTGTFTNGTSGSMGLGPSIGYSKSYQWLDQQVKDIIEMLEFENERLKKALRGNGAFYTYVYIACENIDALSAAQAAAKSTWQNEFAMTNPLQVLDLSDEEQQHLLYHFTAFSADITRENVGGVSSYKYATVLLPSEAVAYTHLPRVSEGGIDTNIDDVPKFRVPGLTRGEIYMGNQLNSERFTFLNGYDTQFDYRIPVDELMHGVFTGQSRSGKTVAAMRFVRELANCRRTATGKRLRLVIMDPKQDWRGIARFVEPERFRFYSMGNTHFRPINLNPCKIPYRVEPQHWIDGIVNIYCRSYGLLERGKQMLSDTFFKLYEQAGCFKEEDRDDPSTWRKDIFGNVISKDWEEEISWRSSSVTFHKIYKDMENKKNDLVGPGKKAGNDTIDAYSRLLERLSCFSRKYSIEYRLFSAEGQLQKDGSILETAQAFEDIMAYGTGLGVDELIGADDVTVFESFGLESTFSSFIFGIITSGFYKVAKGFERGYLNPSQYETVLIIEEANKVLTGSDTAGTGGGGGMASLSGQSEFEEILDQAAGYGLFIFAITQKISMMPSSIVANCGLLFIGKISQPEDVDLAVRMIGREGRIEDRDVVKWLPKSPTGWFICRSSRGFDFKNAEPVLVKIEPLNNAVISNAELDEILTNKEIAEVLNRASA